MNYDTYDLNDIFPYKIYTTQDSENLENISKKLKVPISDLEYFNDLQKDSSKKKFKSGTVK